MYDIFEKLLERYNVTAYKVAKDTGLSTSMLTNWKKGRYKPKQDKLQIIADYFGVSLEYLLTGKEPEKDWEPKLTEKDEQDIQKKLEETLNQLDDDSTLLFSGEPMDEETKELLRASLETTIRNAKLIAKKKFTPKKYKK